MSDEEEKSKEAIKETIDRLHKICKQLHEENERLKEKIRTFYGY